MANVTSFMSLEGDVNETLIPSLNELLEQLGFDLWKTVVNTFILPVINLIGTAMCSFSLWIFSRSSFEDPIPSFCIINFFALSISFI